MHYLLTTTEFFQWGWRIMYMIAAVFSLILYFYRKKLIETNAFIELKDNSIKKSALYTIMTSYRREFLICLLIYAFSNIDYIVAGPFPTFLYQLFHISLGYSALVNTIANILSAFVLMILGYSINRFIPKQIFGIRAFLVFMSLLTVTWFICMFTTQKQPFLSFAVSDLLYSTLSNIPIIVCSIFIPTRFPTSIRYTASALIFNLNALIFGGFAPLISSLLIKLTGNISMLYGLCFAFSIISLIPLGFLKSNKNYIGENGNLAELAE